MGVLEMSGEKLIIDPNGQVKRFGDRGIDERIARLEAKIKQQGELLQQLEDMASQLTKVIMELERSSGADD
jgi:hypothetical protein